LLTKTVVLVVRDEEFYIDMCLDSILPYIDCLYILDTGSKDRTVEIIFEFGEKYPNKILLEFGNFGGDRRFALDYRESEARNYALTRAKELYNSDWIICMDADEVYTSNFWNLFSTIDPDVGSIGHSTDCPTTPTTMSRHPLSMVNWGPHKLHDPHCRIWNVHKYNVEWINPKNRHVILSHNGSDDLVCDLIIDETVHFHFHHIFGPKSFYSWVNKGLLTQPGNGSGLLSEDIYHQEVYEKNYPQLFNERNKFVPPKEMFKNITDVSVPISEKSKLSNFVIEKWNNWWDISEFSVV